MPGTGQCCKVDIKPSGFKNQEGLVCEQSGFTHHQYREGVRQWMPV